MNENNESCKLLRKHYRGAQVAAALGLALYPAVEARADYNLAGRTTMRVAMHADLNLPLPSQATVTAAFTQGTTAIQNDVGVQDVACPLTLAMHNSFGTTYSGSSGGADDDISSSAELTATQNTSGALVNIVDSITFCGTSGSFAGCASTATRKGFVITKAGITGGAGGIILAHEFGHTAGRNHDNNALRIMDPDPLTTAHVEVTPFGCDNETDSFRRVFPASCTGNPACSSELVVIETGDDDFFASVTRSSRKSPDTGTIESEVFEESDFSALSVTELLEGFIIDRVPAEVEDYYGDEDVDALIAVLFDPAQREQHLNAVNFVGLISSGTDAHVQALIDYVGQPEAHVDVAMISLGYIANRTGNDEALLFLADQFAIGPNAEAASGGLTVSGDSLARDLLLEAAQRETDPVAKFTLEERVNENERIELMGLREHYLNPPALTELSADWVPAPVQE
jgi:hypothetical protein